MDKIITGLVVTLAGVVLLSGCGKKQETPTAAPSPAPTAVASQPAASTAAAAKPAASTAAAAVKDMAASARSAVEKAMALAKEGKYQEALALLQQASAEVQGNAEGKSLIDNAIAQIKQMMADAAAKAASDKVGGTVGKALGGLPK